jgi:hypothetical protein
MRIDSSEFCGITLDRGPFLRDIHIDLSGKVARRNKKRSNKYWDRSPTILCEDARFVHERRFDALVLGPGQSGNVPVSREAGQTLQHLIADRSVRRRWVPTGLITRRVAQPRPLACPT